MKPPSLRRACTIGLCAALLVPTSAAIATAESEPVVEWGYLPVSGLPEDPSDDALLRFTVVRPAGPGPFPVAMAYSYYADGVDPVGDLANQARSATDLLARGYAVVGVNIRGSGCSSGTYRVLEPRWGHDGAQAVQWLAGQSWSTGRVGLFGTSGPGLVQFMVAAQQPQSLAAISPTHVLADTYRDVAAPGGIPNPGFLAFWGLGAQPGYSHAALVAAQDQGDDRCAEHVAGRGETTATQNAFLEGAEHPYDDDMHRSRSPERYLGDVDVPTLIGHSWQDDMINRAGSLLLDELDPKQTWAVFTNGWHAILANQSPAFLDIQGRFFDRFVKGERNGFDRGPRIQVWHESTRVAERQLEPSWVTTHRRWPVKVAPLSLPLGDGALLPSTPVGEPSSTSSWAHPAPAPTWGGPPAAHAVWWEPPAPGSSVAFTSRPLERDLEVFGPGSVDLWLSSTATSTDLQVTVTEVRPDGQEVYLQRGWLRASHRELDPQRTTELRPFQTHRAADVEALPIGQPVEVRVELFPIGHVFRAGSSIRLWVEAPGGLHGMWSLEVDPTPAVNTIHHDGTYPSRLVLGVVEGGEAWGAVPPCETMVSTYCRPDPDLHGL